ncbi:MAG: PQQ-dependent dehydrogenase, methanol/ethanol family [Candidatus Acidiferrales bacterium]
MLKHNYVAWVAVPILLFLSSGRQTKPLDDSMLRSADRDTSNWLMYGRTDDDHRFSPLNQINDETAGKLGLAWSRELNTTRGLEATPLVEDGVIYATGSWSVVYAIDAKTGELRWRYDPKVPRAHAFFICCDVVNRGVALYKGKVYVGTLDSRLIALDEHSGAPVWSVSTADSTTPYAITSAPRIANGMVVIGNAGGEFGVRGYISAYDAETGKMVWRSYIVPGDPSKGFESKSMESAAKTWSGEWWKTGGGGAAWEGIVYDPELDLLYFGTGNPTAWYRSLRGGGDCLYTASILAVHASNGEIAWHFQTTPGDNWDYDATEPLVQADLTIGGRTRKVIMQANKNGFFYVLDRKTGEFISGTPFVDGITWATGLDPKTGRPIESKMGYEGPKPVIVSPSPDGAHNWHPIAFSPATGLVYLSAKVDTHMLHAPDAKWKYDPDDLNIGLENYDGPLNAKMASLPPPTGELLAWDPVRQRAAWRVKYPVAESAGTLATGGNLVFQGRADGIFAAYRATDGKQLWTFDAGTGIMAPPVTYQIDGVQYVSILAGWGGTPGLFNAPGAGPVKPGYGRILTFMLGGTATLHAPAYGHKNPPPVPSISINASPQVVHQGALLYGGNCAHCHGINAVAGPVADLRYSSKGVLEGFDGIVRGGSLASVGMPSFGKILNAEQVRAIQAYIVSRIRESAEPAGGQPKQ